MTLQDLLSGDPDVTYTDGSALEEGHLVDLFGLGVKVYWNGKPITRMTTTLFDVLERFNSGGSPEAQASAYTAMVALLVKGATDTSTNPGEPADVLFQTREIPALDGRDLFIHANDTTEYADVPGSDGGWTLMFTSDY